MVQTDTPESSVLQHTAGSELDLLAGATASIYIITHRLHQILCDALHPGSSHHAGGQAGGEASLARQLCDGHVAQCGFAVWQAACLY